MESRRRKSYFASFVRWWWLILLIILATEAAVIYTLNTLPPSFKTSVKLQVIAPGPREVSLFGDVRAQAFRDEVFLVQNNFIEIIKSDAIAQRATEQLGLSIPAEDIPRNLTVSPVPNTDFVYVYLEWPDPEQGPLILSAQVRLAQEYFAKARARPASNARQFISQQLVGAKDDLERADAAFAKFKAEHRIVDIDQEIKSLQEVLTSLRLERERARSRGEQAAAATLDQALNERFKQMSDLITTSFEYRKLEAAVGRADDTYRFLQGKESEAILKENESLSVDFIQVLEDARTPALPVPPRTREIAILGAVAALLIGSLLALVFDLEVPSSRNDEATIRDGIKQGVVSGRAGTAQVLPGVTPPPPAQSQTKG